MAQSTQIGFAGVRSKNKALAERDEGEPFCEAYRQILACGV